MSLKRWPEVFVALGLSSQSPLPTVPWFFFFCRLPLHFCVWSWEEAQEPRWCLFLGIALGRTDDRFGHWVVSSLDLGKRTPLLSLWLHVRPPRAHTLFSRPYSGHPARSAPSLRGQIRPQCSHSPGPRGGWEHILKGEWYIGGACMRATHQCVKAPCGVKWGCSWNEKVGGLWAQALGSIWRLVLDPVNVKSEPGCDPDASDSLEQPWFQPVFRAWTSASCGFCEFLLTF